MTEPPVPYGAIQAFFAAYASRNPARMMEVLSDDVEWRFLGPVDIFPFCGQRRGKAAVVEHFNRLVPTVFSVRGFEPEQIVIDGNRAATFSKMTAFQAGTGRAVTYHCVHFVTFRDGKAVAVHSLADTFTVVEQLLGAQFMSEPAPQADVSSEWVAL